MFLNAFLRAIGHQEVSAWRPDVTVKVEDLTREGRRIDIVVVTPHSIVGIENKPYAAQGENQLAAYIEDIERRPGPQQQRCIVFLSLQEPETAADRVIRMTFVREAADGRSLTSVLRDALNDVKAERITRFVTELIGWIDRIFGGAAMIERSSYTDYLIEQFSTQPDRKKAIGIALATQNRICESVLNGIGNVISSKLSELYDDIVSEGLPLSSSISKKYGGLSIRRKRWVANVSLSLSAEQRNLTCIIYGLRALAQDTTEALVDPEQVCDSSGALRERVAETMPKANVSNWWPWYAVHPSSVWSSQWVGRLLVESNGKPEAHPETEMIIDAFVALAKVVDEVATA